MNVDRNSHSYRRGLILGWTLAQVFVLILFVLLLAFAALYGREKASLVKISDLTVDLERLSTQLNQIIQANGVLRRKQDFLKSHGNSSDKFDDLFRQLALCEETNSALEDALPRDRVDQLNLIAKCARANVQLNQQLTELHREEDRRRSTDFEFAREADIGRPRHGIAALLANSGGPC